MQNDDTDLQKKFDSLPEDLKAAITSVDFAESLQSIGKNNGLQLDQLDQLFEEVGFVMLGIIHPNDFGKKIMQLFHLDEAKKNSLVLEVDEKIFKPIRASLVAIYEKPSESKSNLVEKPADQASLSPNIPHESDYSMSRDDILSAIENPQMANRESTVSKRAFETNNPKEYLARRGEVLKNLESKLLNQLQNKEALVKKHSLTEEALMIAKGKTFGQKNTADQKPETSTVVTPTTITSTNTVNSIVSPPSISIISPLPAPRPSTPDIITVASFPKPSDKLEKVVQIPRQIINVSPIPITPSATTSNATKDPYREIV